MEIMNAFEDYPQVIHKLEESVEEVAVAVESHKETDLRLLGKSPKQVKTARHSLESEGIEPNELALAVVQRAQFASSMVGADRLEGFDQEAWDLLWSLTYFDFLEEMSRKPQAIASRVLKTFFEASESFEVGGWGAHLSYLAMAIVDPIQNPKMKFMWDLNDEEDAPTRKFRELMNSLFETSDPVWEYVEVVKKRG